MSEVNGDNSTLDRFLVTNNLFNTIFEYRSLHDVDILSDHEALQLILQIPINYLPGADVAHTHKKALWDIAFLRELQAIYRDVSDDILDKIVIPKRSRPT